MALAADHGWRQKTALIESILHDEDLYRILGAPRTCSAIDIRRHYLDRSKICHPDKPPFHPDSTRYETFISIPHSPFLIPHPPPPFPHQVCRRTKPHSQPHSAFQRLAFAYEILKTPSSRQTYDRASSRSTSSTTASTNPSIGAEHAYPYRATAQTLLDEFLSGDFGTVRAWLATAHQRYPHWFSGPVVRSIERGLVRLRDLTLSSRTYAQLLWDELRRVGRVARRFRRLGALDVLGRARVTLQLVRVTLAIPMRVDRAQRRRAEHRWRAKSAGLQAAGLSPPPAAAVSTAGFLNERVVRVLEFIVGDAGKDEI
ncbi:putative DnaJ like protein subfamily B member 11 [Cryomyces antarcticus]